MIIPRQKSFSENEKRSNKTEKVLKGATIAASTPAIIRATQALNEANKYGIHDKDAYKFAKKASKHAKLAGGLAIGTAIAHDYNKNKE
jgi:hypothetical protein